jgi:hypothetical protein
LGGFTSTSENNPSILFNLVFSKYCQYCTDCTPIVCQLTDFFHQIICTVCKFWKLFIKATKLGFCLCKRLWNQNKFGCFLKWSLIDSPAVIQEEYVPTKCPSAKKGLKLSTKTANPPDLLPNLIPLNDLEQRNRRTFPFGNL